MILINIDQITYIDCGTSATSVIGNPYIDIHFTNGKSKRISCESDVQLHTIVNKIVTNSRYKITFVSDLFSQSD